MPAERASASGMAVGQGSAGAEVSRSAESGDVSPSSGSGALGGSGPAPAGAIRGRFSRPACQSAKPGGGPAAGALRAVATPLTACAGTDGSSATGAERDTR